MDKIDSQIRPKHKMNSSLFIFPFSLLRSRTPFKIQLGAIGERCKLPAGSGAEPEPKSNVVHFS